MSNFDRAFKAVIEVEKGFVDHPNDPGGATKYGITKRDYPNEDIPNLTIARAKELYRKNYWDPLKGDELTYEVAAELFDAAVNCGVYRTVVWMQSAVGAVKDGKLGPATLLAVRKLPPMIVVAKLVGFRLRYYTSLPNWQYFGRGWTNRVADNLLKIGE